MIQVSGSGHLPGLRLSGSGQSPGMRSAVTTRTPPTGTHAPSGLWTNDGVRNGLIRQVPRTHPVERERTTNAPRVPDTRESLRKIMLPDQRGPAGCHVRRPIRPHAYERPVIRACPGHPHPEGAQAHQVRNDLIPHVDVVDVGLRAFPMGDDRVRGHGRPFLPPQDAILRARPRQSGRVT